MAPAAGRPRGPRRKKNSAAEITVSAKEGFNFKPGRLEVEAGGEVVLTFENDGRMSHNLHIPELDVATETIGPGKSVTVRFTPDNAGTFSFLCTVPGHEQAGMVGDLTVR